MSEAYFSKYYGEPFAQEIAGHAPQPSLTLEQILRILYRGRTMTNFSHVPEVTRAIDWLCMDFRKALEPSAHEVGDEGAALTRGAV